jgi:hypothetical protein
MLMRRQGEEFSVSFLDVICCGFGAIILLLMLSKSFESQVTSITSEKLQAQLQQREQQLFEIRGEIEELRRQIVEDDADLSNLLLTLGDLQRQLTQVQGQFEDLAEAEAEVSTQKVELARARQSLTDEMQRLLGLNFRRESGLVGGISVDSEYIIFVIDTSGSMQSAAWGQAVRKVQETLSIYPQVKGIQVMNDMGDYMFPEYRRQWIQDSPSRRSNIITRLRNWAPFSNSSPVEGISAAIQDFYDPDKRISIYVFGDDFTGNSIEEVVEAVDRVNVADASGRRRVRIHAVAFPVYLDQPNARVFRFAALMRELAYRNDGTFVGLTEYQ